MMMILMVIKTKIKIINSASLGSFFPSQQLKYSATLERLGLRGSLIMCDRALPPLPSQHK